MKSSKKVARFLSLFIIFTLFASLLIGILLGKGTKLVAHANTEHNHTGWTAWDNSSGLPSSAGSYYLTVDVSLNDQWHVPSGEVNLCLNGHGITQVK